MGEGVNGALTEVRVPDRVSDGTNVQRVSNPLLEVSLPGDVEQVARHPQANDGQMSEMGGEQLLVKLLLGHAVVALEIVSRGDAVPDAAGSRVLGQTLAERREFRCHERGQRVEISPPR